MTVPYQRGPAMAYSPPGRSPQLRRLLDLLGVSYDARQITLDLSQPYDVVMVSVDGGPPCPLSLSWDAPWSACEWRERSGEVTKEA